VRVILVEEGVLLVHLVLGSLWRRLASFFDIRQFMRASLRRIISTDKTRVGLLGKGTITAESLMG
jgi:hypothetical protein